MINHKNRIAILGGSFDPPTLGHLKIAEYLVNSMSFDEVWIIPAYTHTFEKNLSDFSHRMNMCNILFNDKRFVVSDFQKSRNCDSSTLNLFKLLEQEYKDKEFFMIIGSDNANIIDKWINYEQIIKKVKFIIIERKNYELKHNITWCLESPHIYVKDFDIDEISSTLARNSIKNEENVYQYISEYVMYYIKENNLYK